MRDVVTISHFPRRYMKALYTVLILEVGLIEVDVECPGIPPRYRHLHITFCACDNEAVWQRCSYAYLDTSQDILKYNIDLCKSESLMQRVDHVMSRTMDKRGLSQNSCHW